MQQHVVREVGRLRERAIAALEQRRRGDRQHALAEQSNTRLRRVRVGHVPDSDVDIAATEIDQANDFYEAYALTGYQVLRALAVMTMAVSPAPPQTAEEATRRANESVAERLKVITVRFGAN